MGRSDRGGPSARYDAAPPQAVRVVRVVAYQVLFTLAAVTLWVLLFVSLAAVGGCSEGGTHHCHGYWIAPANGARASLIFTAEPGLTPLPAEAITRGLAHDGWSDERR